MAEKTAQRVKPKGTAKTEMVIGTAAAKLSAASKAVLEAFSQSEKLVEIMDENALRIAHQEEQITNLAADYERAKAENDFNLQMEYRQGENEFAKGYLEKNDLVAVPNDEYTGLKDKYNTLKKDFDNKLATETAINRNTLEKEYNNQRNLDAANAKADAATKDATITQLNAQLMSAIETAASWKAQLEAQRAAETERAKHSQIGTLNLGGTGGR